MSVPISCWRRVVVIAMVGAWLVGRPAPAQEAGKPGAGFPRHVLIIRHAEKTYEPGDVKLSKLGTQRAEALPLLFVASKDRPDPFPVPDFIFTARITNKSHRSLDTVAPLGAKLKIPVNSDFRAAPTQIGAVEKGVLAMRDEVLGKSKYAGKTILISWNHSGIPDVAQAFKATKAPAKWRDEVFDRVWQITYDAEGNVTFVNRPQRLLPGDVVK